MQWTWTLSTAPTLSEFNISTWNFMCCPHLSLPNNNHHLSWNPPSKWNWPGSINNGSFTLRNGHEDSSSSWCFLEHHDHLSVYNIRFHIGRHNYYRLALYIIMKSFMKSLHEKFYSEASLRHTYTCISKSRPVNPYFWTPVGKRSYKIVPVIDWLID